MRRTPAVTAHVPLLAAYAAALSLTTPAFAKTPGEVHCYNGICHRVKTVDEVRLLVGVETEALTSFYDSADKDSMNAGTITSSGEVFDADSEAHAASSLLPDGTELLIWNPKNRNAAHIRVNDFGPFYMKRSIDVTRAVAERLEFTKSGVANLLITVVWAPDPEDARFRRRREYPAVEGYLGKLDYDQFAALKQRLIETGPARNKKAPVMASAPSYALPAYSGLSGGERVASKVAILNTPRVALTMNGPVVTLPAVWATSPAVTASARAIAAASRGPAEVIAARDAGVAPTVATLVPEQAPATAVAFAAPPPITPVSTSSANKASLAGSYVPAARPWAPNSLLWQQLLVALGFLSVATVGWRTRPFGRAPSRLAAAQASVAASFGGGAPGNDVPGDPPLSSHKGERMGESANIFTLPRLPKKTLSKPIDELSADAARLMEQGDLAQAATIYREILANIGDNGGAAVVNTERDLADCLREQGRYAAAEPHYRRALAALAALVGADHPATADLLDAYAVSVLRQGRGVEAERLIRQSLAIRRTGGLTTRAFAVSTSILAETLRAQGQLNAAEAEHRMAWSTFIAVSGQDSVDAAASMTSIGTVLGELGRFGPAEELLNSGTQILSQLCGYDHPISAAGYHLLGDLYRRAGALEPAREMQAHALSVRERVLGTAHPDTIESVLSLALIANEQYRAADAQILLDRALDSLIAGERQQLGPQSRIRLLLVALQAQYHDGVDAVRLAAE